MAIPKIFHLFQKERFVSARFHELIQRRGAFARLDKTQFGALDEEHAEV
jgi:hypothetical protein